MSYYERTYGEINDLDELFKEIKNILFLNKLNINNYIFYDFGSGYGKIVDFFSKYCKKSIGIEIDKVRYNESIKFISENINFYNENFFDTIIQNSCIILINNLCLGDGTNKRLSFKLLNECKEKDIIILTKKMLFLEDHFLYFKLIKCSWGYSELYFYKLKVI